ncbi:MAG: hypothetical protein RL557_508 [archaeon]|jgi:hypothetical protein
MSTQNLILFFRDCERTRDSPLSGDSEKFSEQAAELTLRSVKKGYVLHDPELMFDGEIQGGGIVEADLETLAKKAYNNHFLREPFSIETIPSSRFYSSRYFETRVSDQDIKNFINYYFSFKK